MIGKDFKPQRGEVYLADLNPRKGSVQSGVRPVVVLQNNIINGVFNTTIVAALSSSESALKAKDNPSNVFIDKGCGIRKDSVVKLTQTITIDKAYFKCKVPITKLSGVYMDKIEKAIKFTLNMGEKCKKCGNKLEDKETVCRKCNELVKNECIKCGSSLNLEWVYCPICGRRYV